MLIQLVTAVLILQSACADVVSNEKKNLRIHENSAPKHDLFFNQEQIIKAHEKTMKDILKTTGAKTRSSTDLKHTPISKDNRVKLESNGSSMGKNVYDGYLISRVRVNRDCTGPGIFLLHVSVFFSA